MREILFRAKGQTSNKWYEGLLTRLDDDVCHIKDDRHTEWICDTSTVCQYTGLKDKNGKKIFEGDIVKCGVMFTVSWSEQYAGWCLTMKGWMYSHFFGEACEPKDCEVIGNIFDNPGLIRPAGKDSGQEASQSALMPAI